MIWNCEVSLYGSYTKTCIDLEFVPWLISNLFYWEYLFSFVGGTNKFIDIIYIPCITVMVSGISSVLLTDSDILR